MHRNESYEVATPGLKSTSSNNTFRYDTYTLISLQKENQDMRKRLKELNYKLTEAISLKESKKPKAKIHVNVEEELHIAQSRLESYV